MSDPPRPGREPGDPLLRAIAAHWAEIRAQASDEQWERVRRLVAGITEPTPVRPTPPSLTSWGRSSRRTMRSAC